MVESQTPQARGLRCLTRRRESFGKAEGERRLTCPVLCTSRLREAVYMNVFHFQKGNVSMRVRSVRGQGIPGIGEISVDLRGDVVVIQGDNGSGKSLICRAIGDAFAPALFTGRRGKTSDLPGEVWNVEFESGSEVISVSIRNGRVDSSVALKRGVRVDGRAEGVVLPYGMSRPCGPGGRGEGVRAVYPLLHDLHLKEMRGCVVLVDDFELGLSYDNRKLVFEHLRKNLVSKDCQFILTTREPEVMSLGGRGVILSGGVDVIAEALKVLKLKQ